MCAFVSFDLFPTSSAKLEPRNSINFSFRVVGKRKKERKWEKRVKREERERKRKESEKRSRKRERSRSLAHT